jgi:nucleotide-binding universal stress UspA family protein
MSSTVTITPIGLTCGIVIVVLVVSIVVWMQKLPKTKADAVARAAEKQLAQQLRTTIVVFSSEIRSEHMMVLAARLARGRGTELMAVYIIEVPFTLPTQAPMEEEDRIALDTLAAAEVIARHYGVELRTEVIHHRFTPQAVLELAKALKADLIIMGSYREGEYTGAPLGSTIEEIAASAKCDVLIGVEGKHGTLLGEEPAAPVTQSGSPSVTS